jgi:hypothetical protein
LSFVSWIINVFLFLLITGIFDNYRSGLHQQKDG